MIDPITPFKIQKVLDLCSGIGGFTLGHLISGGFETVAFCEINSYCQQVLNLRFPHIPIIPDIHDITTESLYGVGVTKVDGIIAGLPCPPFSLEGKRLASKDDRNLFGEFFRIICEVRLDWAIVENVPGLITAESGQFLRTVLWQFAQMGFDVEWGIVSASQVGAVHLRERVWIIAHSQSSRRGTSWSQYTQERTNTASVGCGDHCSFQRSSQSDNSVEYKARAIAQRTFSGGDDGFPTRLDRCLLTHAGLTDCLTAATVPSFSRLSRREIAALTLYCQQEYRQLWAEYQAIRRQHKQQLIALGNAIVPQCAALIFERLKRVLFQQRKTS
ncbi:MAG: DNA cytosine methyltransferase [Nostoc sp. DedSLP03]|uniref:DNA cytosine methyltransferase n=1 Tax=Nostoc sp. DedSLP03 TaxID=3075400 RepID=UPI002AD5311A|nr:DNA cytosine methyltransferase [Nostoc sp. DedSLP03]MDZ7965874.1 DNA cytosine methyltransferase [Nostoc sp. DedSLP03]